ncbi:MAG TPA: EAL domain-containing protein [Gaiellaceae bacterium]|nr:EAL domain-containing protein [Gaiellaceae bacterium]
MTSERAAARDDAATESSRSAHAVAILDAALDAVITIDHLGRVLEFNRAAESVFGYRKDEVIGRELAGLVVPPESREAHRRALVRWTASGPSKGAGALLGRRIEVEAMRSDGSRFPAELAISQVDAPGAPLFTACIRDVTDRKKGEEALRLAEVRYRTLVEQLPLAIYIDRVDPSSSNIYSSPQLESMLGYSADEWVSDPLLFVELLHPDDRERVLAAHARMHATSEALHVEYRLKARDGRWVWVQDEARVVEDGTQRVVQGYLLDITARREAEEQLRHQAFHDPLTGLANRALFTNRVHHALVVRAHEHGQVAVLFLDLDDFKAVNDGLGHLAGDALLRAVGVRLRASLPPSLTVARMGGDEFAILVEEPNGASAALDAAERVTVAFQRPFDVDGREVFVTASVGIAVGDDADELLRCSDVAMYGAKASGKAQYVVYAARMDEHFGDRLELVADLRRARIAEEFVLHYEPVVDLATGAVLGVEALVRWRHPTRGLLEPVEFISLAEETGRIVDIGRWVLAEACRQTATWQKELPLCRALAVSVNVSTRQVRRPGLLEDVEAALLASGLAPRALTLEITETVLARRRGEMTTILEEVTSRGVRLALDDFGTGYSSLSLLRDLPVHTLKVDRSFVHSIGAERRRAAFVRAIVELAEALDLTVVAEGIEEVGQVVALKRVGCRMGQGFHFAGPLPPLELESFVRANLGRSAA